MQKTNTNQQNSNVLLIESSVTLRLPSNSCKPITNTAWVRAQFCKLQKRCTRLAAASDKVYQLLAHGRWFSPSTPASSTTKTEHHAIAEILLKVALCHQKSTNQSIKLDYSVWERIGDSDFFVADDNSNVHPLPLSIQHEYIYI